MPSPDVQIKTRMEDRIGDTGKAVSLHASIPATFTTQLLDFVYFCLLSPLGLWPSAPMWGLLVQTTRVEHLEHSFSLRPYSAFPPLPSTWHSTPHHCLHLQDRAEPCTCVQTSAPMLLSPGQTVPLKSQHSMHLNDCTYHALLSPVDVSTVSVPLLPPADNTSCSSSAQHAQQWLHPMCMNVFDISPTTET